MGNNQSNHFPHIPEKVTWSLNTIINGKSQTLLSDFFEVRGGCTQAIFKLEFLLRNVSEKNILKPFRNSQEFGLILISQKSEQLPQG